MENLFRINPEYKGEPKPKKEEEDLVFQFKEPEENESPADSKKFVRYENEQELSKKEEDKERLKVEMIKVLTKQAEEIYDKIKFSNPVSKEYFIQKYIRDHVKERSI